uniref:Uncharacterized protein n=1 Tax=Hucho hucho TaxID=62062 RepID=A0A4W5LCB0_9TELE
IVFQKRSSCQDHKYKFHLDTVALEQTKKLLESVIEPITLNIQRISPITKKGGTRSGHRVDPGEVCCRYGEKNHAFTVASYFSDENETKKVTSAVESVTSDYHSGSSSDEDSSLSETRPPPTFPQNHHTYQVIYPAASLWSPPVPKQKKMGPGRPIQPFRHNGWTLPGQRGGHGYWGGTPGLAYC